MSPSDPTLQQSIAANKFYPPRINRSKSIARHAIIADRIDVDEPTKRIIVVEAQAGQGKTTLVHQYLEHSGIPFIWYQIGTEDSDPVVLLTALKLALSRKISRFSSPQLEAVLEQGQIGPMDLKGCANILLNDIDRALTEDVFLVFDDLHLIKEAELTTRLLDYLIDTSPPPLHFILTSRHPLRLSARAVRKNPHLLYLDSDDLALDVGQIEALYTDVLNTEIDRFEAERILEVTNGWIMGIVLAAHPLAEGNKSMQTGRVFHRNHRLLAASADNYIVDFFRDEIFTHIPAALHETFMKLAFLDEIDVGFASSLATVDDIGSHLSRLADENFFVYRLDDNDRMFRFHHLFQEFLQSMAAKALGSEAIGAIYRRAAEHYLQRDLIEKALKALRHGEDFTTMAQVLKRHGLRLVAANHTVTILGILQTIPEQTLREHGWLTFFHGLLTTDFNPQQTLPSFEACIARFDEAGEEAGELMALSQIIYFHFVISGRYDDGSRLLERTRTLFEANHERLPPEISIVVSRNLAAGYCFFDGNMEVARHYARLGCRLAVRNESRNFTAATRFILGYIGLLSGDRRQARSEIERSYPLTSDPLVGMSNRLTLHVMQLCELSMHGDMAAFLHHKDLVHEGVDPEIVRQTVAAPYLYVWSAIGLIGSGRANEALDVLERGMSVSRTAMSEHMSSQFHQWRAFVHALAGDEGRTVEDIERATRMRAQAGGRFFTGYHLVVKGAALTLIGHWDEGRRCLGEALEIADHIGSTYLEAGALAYLCRADIATRSGDTGERLAAWLGLMRSCDYDYFWGWEPGCMLEVLAAAVRHDIDPEFARDLAARRVGYALPADGEPVPLLRIKVLGTFSIGLGGEELFGPQDLSANQRELFGLLIASPDFRISQEQVQFSFWPDSPPDKASKTYYTLVSRLRKALSTKLSDPTRYILVEKGYVQLRHVVVDAGDFLRHARLGLKLGRQEQWWQAGNAFTRALACWDRLQSIDFFLSDRALQFIDEVNDTMRVMCLFWADALRKLNRADEALGLLEKTDRILLLDEDSVALRHKLYLQKKNPLKARALRKSYRQELLRLDYTEDEAAEMVATLSPQAGIDQ